MILLIKASLVVIFLLSFYKLLLEKESFFFTNRIYLLGCLFLACLLPFIVLPKIIENQGIVDSLFSDKVSVQTIDLNSNIERDLVRNDILFSDENPESKVLDLVPTIDKDEILNTNSNTIIPSEFKSKEAFKSDSKGLVYWMFWIYIFGVIVLAFNLLGQLLNVLLKVVNNKDQIEDEGIVIVNMTKDVEPCSFFKYIFINPSSYDFDTYEQIVAHEKIHVSKRHSIDLLLAELAIVILWFNPFVWLLRKEVEKNIEYQTDATLLYEESDSKEAYQLNLVKIACNTSPLAITTNYNQSLIKQRIIKMNSKKSNQFNYWKYAFSMPIVFVLLLLLNRPFEAISNTSGIQMQPIIIDSEAFSEVDETNESSIKLEDAESMSIENEVPKEDGKISKTESIQPIVLDSKLIANCEEFEKAVAEGNLELVKEILKTLDPDCLKIKKNEKSNLTAVVNLLKKKKAEFKIPRNSENSIDKEKADVCDRLRTAVLNRNRNKTKEILRDENVTCLTDIYGAPTNNISLIKGLLSYNARINFHTDNRLSIHEIYFEINIDDYESSYCQDPNYLRLVSAIQKDDDSKIREILSEGGMICPLNEDGATNDFIFIKELMNYDPVITNQNRRGIRVGGVGIEIDMSTIDENAYSNDALNSNSNQENLLSDIENSLSSSRENEGKISCIELIDAIEGNDTKRTEQLINLVDLDCYHRRTRTVTSEEREDLTTSTVNTPLITAIRQQKVVLIKQLLEKGADINYAGNGKATPLIAAVLSRNTKIIKLMVDRGAEINRRDEANFTALYYGAPGMSHTLEG